MLPMRSLRLPSQANGDSGSAQRLTRELSDTDVLAVGLGALRSCRLALHGQVIQRRGRGPGTTEACWWHLGPVDNLLSSEGQFWLPERPDRLISGKVTGSEDGVVLALDDSLVAFEMPEGGVRLGGQQSEHPFVHGVLRDGRPVTLLDVTGTDLSGPFGRIHDVRTVRAALVGGHVEQDLFAFANVEFDLLNAWAAPNPVTTQAGPGRQPVVVPLDLQQLVETEAAGREVAVRAEVVGTTTATTVRLDQVCSVRITGPAAGLHSIQADWLRPVHDFLVVAVGRPCRMTRLQVRQPDAGPRDRTLDVHVASLQPAAPDVLSVSRARSYDSPALHLREDTDPDVAAVLAAWHQVHKELREVVDLLTGPFHAPFTYVEHRYASTFQSAEAYAKRRHGGKEKTKGEHRERVEAVTAALAASGLPEDVAGWATRLVQGRNDRSLPQMIDGLARGCGPAGAELLAAAPRFARQAADLRVGVAHGGSGRPDPLVAYWHGQALLWLVRIALLAEAGVPVDRTSARATSTPAWKRAVAEIVAHAAALETAASDATSSEGRGPIPKGPTTSGHTVTRLDLRPDNLSSASHASNVPFKG